MQAAFFGALSRSHSMWGVYGVKTPEDVEYAMTKYSTGCGK